MTAWELVKEGIPVALITDSMAGYVMARGMVDCVIVGADRIAANGDVANRIGTYSVAVLAREHGLLPMYVVAPRSTIDQKIASGEEIAIEQRSADEVTTLGGKEIAPVGVDVFNPSFDVTPAKLVRRSSQHLSPVWDAGAVSARF